MTALVNSKLLKLSNSKIINNKEFIEDIKKRPILWNRLHPDFQSRALVSKEWLALQKKYPKLTVLDLKKRWKNIKDQYRKELKKYPPGSAHDGYGISWKYFSSMAFMKDSFIRQLSEDSTADPLDIDSPKSEPPTSAPASPTAIDEDNEEDTEPSQADYTQPQPSKDKVPYKLRLELLRIEKRKLQILEDEVKKENSAKSETYHFLMSLLPEMEKLTRVQNMRVRSKMIEAIYTEMIAPEEKDAVMVAVEDSITVKEEPINMYQ